MKKSVYMRVCIYVYKHHRLTCDRLWTVTEEWTLIELQCSSRIAVYSRPTSPRLLNLDRSTVPPGGLPPLLPLTTMTFIHYHYHMHAEISYSEDVYFLLINVRIKLIVCRNSMRCRYFTTHSTVWRRLK